MRKTVCSKCDVNKVEIDKRYCPSCRAEYMRGWRKKEKERMKNGEKNE